MILELLRRIKDKHGIIVSIFPHPVEPGVWSSRAKVTTFGAAGDTAVNWKGSIHSHEDAGKAIDGAYLEAINYKFGASA